MRAAENPERGSALVVVTMVIVMLTILAMAVLSDGAARTSASLESWGDTQALSLAETGIALKLADLASSQGGDLSPLRLTNAQGSVTVTAVSQGEYVVLTSTAISSGGTSAITRTLEATIRSQFHPLFYKATYVGNQEQIPGNLFTFGPNVGETTGGATFDERSWVHKNSRLSERDLGIDFNGDGDQTDSPRLRDIYKKRSSWGWNGHVTRSSNKKYYKLDINKNGTYTDTYAAPSSSTLPPLRDPDSDPSPATPQNNWATASRTDDADTIEGDVYVNGDIDIRGDSNIFGDVDATGTVQGEPVTGTVTSSADTIAPPDLTAMDYDSIADTVVTPSSIPSFMRGQQSSSYYGDDLGPSNKHDNTHFHLGNQSGNVNLSSSDDGSLILVKGNLWIHSTSSFTIDLPRGHDQRITIVVEGNLYVADDLEYGTADSGVLFIVKSSDTDPESYIDANRNYRYDAGEQLIDDDGDGVYEGPKEGQGNVFFGDPRFGSGGVTDGYIYAQNNVHLVNPPLSVSPPSGQDTIFGVEGLLSAGGLIDLGEREAGEGFNNFRVKYDDRLERGTISFPGMPPSLGGGFEGLAVVAWREIR